MAYQEDEYGNTYYVPDTQYGGNRGDWDWGSGLSAAASGAGTGASIGALFGPAGVPLGAIAGGLLGGAYGLFTGTAEQDRARAAEAANAAALAAARKRMEQGFADERAALQTQRQMLEAQNPAEALYGTQGRQGLLQAQQAMLAQQMAAQGARNRAALASRGLLGSGMEAATSGALAGQQAGAQAQLQANIAQQYMQQQQAQQQQLAQLGLQQAQVRQRQEAARSAQDLTALQMQQQYAQQIAQRNQALLQAGLQGVSTGVSAGLQANALELAKTQRKEDLDLIRQALKINAPAAATGGGQAGEALPLYGPESEAAAARFLQSENDYATPRPDVPQGGLSAADLEALKREEARRAGYYNQMAPGAPTPQMAPQLVEPNALQTMLGAQSPEKRLSGGFGPVKRINLERQGRLNPLSGRPNKALGDFDKSINPQAAPSAMGTMSYPVYG